MKRTLEMKIRFTKDELDALTKKARKSGFSRESFCRRILNGSELCEAPPADYYELIRQLRRTGNNLNQLLKVANGKGLLDVPQFRKELEALRETEAMLWRTFQPEAG